jgi:class 3 adenylate cyclase/GAF domain-containing protein
MGFYIFCRRIIVMFRKILESWSIESKGLYYKLSMVFALFFLVPSAGFVYFAIKYDVLHDEYTALFAIALLVSSFFGYSLIRKVFDDIRATSKNITETITKDISGLSQSAATSEIQNIAQSFRAVENELLSTFRKLDRRVSQISTLKELSDLCYVTFDTEDLFYITLERALKLANADVGSVLILDQPKREFFVVQATIGHGEILRKGERIDFAGSIAKYAVINKSPLLVEDIEKDIRFGRANLSHYGTKSFLCMPLKGINEVLGVLTISRRISDIPFKQEDVEVLAPLLSNAAFTYDNLGLMKENKEKDRHLKVTDHIYHTLGSSLRGSELFHAILKQIQEDIPFEVAMILIRNEQALDRISVLEFFSSIPTSLTKGADFPYAGSIIDKVIKQESSLLIDDIDQLTHPLEQDLFAKHNLITCFLSPLKIDGVIRGVLALGAVLPDALRDVRERTTRLSQLLALAIEKDRLSTSVIKRDQEMESIKQIGSLLAASTFDMEKVLKHTMDMIQTIINVEAGSLMLLDKDELAFRVAFNIRKDINIDLLPTLRLKLGQGIAGYSAARGEPVIVRNAGESRQFYPEIDRMIGFETRSVLCVPLISMGKVIGVIELVNKLDGEFNDNDLHLLQSIATSLSIALENSRLYQETLSMAANERDIRSMFQKFVPKEIVDKIVHDVSEEKLVIDELKTLTLMNIDIRGFSVLAKELGPQKTVSILNYFFTAMGEIVFKHHGIVDKYLGDGFLALFGAPVSNIYDADNAVTTALEMKNAMAAINEHFSDEIDVPLSIGISIHTGEAVVGNIGFEKKMDYTVIGDSVNVVFKLQDLTKFAPNSVLMSEKTLRAVMKLRLDIREMGMYDAGEALGELKIYELLGIKD